MQHDKLLADDAYRGSDGSIVCSLGGMNNKEVHHYTFQPSKQIVSNLFELPFVPCLAISPNISAIVYRYRMTDCNATCVPDAHTAAESNGHWAAAAVVAGHRQHYEFKYLTRK